MALTPAHREYLLSAAISPDVLDASGIASVKDGTAIRFPWTDGACDPVHQLRPDTPELDEKGRPKKYVFPKGARVPLNRLRCQPTATRALIAEGTKQSYAALSHAPADMDVWGLAGVNNFQHSDLTVFDGKAVYLLLDADFRTNSGVYAAAEAFTEKLKLSGAETVYYVVTTGDGKQGLDDVLAALPADKRADSLRRWMQLATDKLPRRPRAKKPTAEEARDGADGSKYFRERSKPLAFQPYDYAMDILKNNPAAVTAEDNIAIYRDGVYIIDNRAILMAATETLKNYYSPGHLKNVMDVLKGHLYGEGSILPEAMDKPIMNAPNGMVDLRNGALLDHDPAYMSYVQVGVVYDPKMPTPRYDAWLRDALRQPHHTDADVEALVADLEETAGTMLDPSRTPSKTLFLFGPSRSGKSTFLRLLRKVAGAANTSAVTLHNLVSDHFAAANLYGKMLNVAADLSNKHVEDLSLFKMITGEDPVQANRKYGNQFEFTNQALVAFSANELPTVSEASRAYAERMKPFQFPNSFAGREDKNLEAALIAELPGILARWVQAYGRFLKRGGYVATDTATQNLFEASSDRVVQFFQDMCTLTGDVHGTRVSDDAATGRRDLSVAFNAWAERNGSSKMGERAFFNRFSQIDGVAEVRMGAKDRRAFNVTVAQADDDSWNAAVPVERDEPTPDPVAPSGVVDEDVWAAAVGDAVRCMVPDVTAAMNGSQKPVRGFDPFAVGLDLDYEL